jgi:hypothetical protein
MMGESWCKRDEEKLEYSARPLRVNETERKGCRREKTQEEEGKVEERATRSEIDRGGKISHRI